MQDPYGKWPEDIRIEQCRQCVAPGCVKACPVKAAHVDEEHGNVRTVKSNKCKKFRECIDRCNFEPSRMIWNFEDRHAQKCDLCADTPFWDREGGPGGRQACVELCPMKAIMFLAEVPEQEGDEGYIVNLRGAAWKKMGYPTD
jgi:protein NrfC